MAKKTSTDAAGENATTQVNIADFQRTRDSVSQPSRVFFKWHHQILCRSSSRVARTRHSSATPPSTQHRRCRHFTLLPAPSCRPAMTPADVIDAMEVVKLDYQNCYQQILVNRYVARQTARLTNELTRISSMIRAAEADRYKFAEQFMQVIVALATLQSSRSGSLPSLHQSCQHCPCPRSWWCSRQQPHQHPFRIWSSDWAGSSSCSRRSSARRA